MINQYPDDNDFDDDNDDDDNDHNLLTYMPLSRVKPWSCLPRSSVRWRTAWYLIIMMVMNCH